MDSNNEHSLPTPSETPQSVVAPDTTPEPTPVTPPLAKKSRKGLIIATSVLAVLLIGSAVFYALWATSGKGSTADVKKPAATTSVTASLNKAVDDATGVMTTSVTNETTVTNTDDSNAASDASNSAATVGDSIDESTF